MWQSIKDILDIELTPVSHTERLASIAGGFLGILLILLVSNYFVGATDAAVVGGSGIHELGYGFLLMPVLLNVLVILAAAVVFNYPRTTRNTGIDYRPQ